MTLVGEHLTTRSNARTHTFAMRELLAIVGVVVFGLMVLHPVLGARFVLVDDHEILSLVPPIGAAPGVRPQLDLPGMAFASDPSVGRFRPLYWTVRFGEIALLGDNASAWHAVVLALGIISACLLYATARALGASYAASVLLGLTRAFALAAGPALFLAALESPGKTGARRYLRAAFLGAVPVAVVLLWVFGMGWVKGEPGLFFRSMEGWHRGSSTLAGIQDFFRGFSDHVLLGDLKRDVSLVLDYVMILVFAAIGVYQIVLRHWSDAAWTACAIGLPITTGLPGGIPRFFAVVYPASFALAEATRNSPRARVFLWSLSGLLLLAASARFVNWQWVA